MFVCTYVHVYIVEALQSAHTKIPAREVPFYLGYSSCVEDAILGAAKHLPQATTPSSHTGI